MKKKVFRVSTVPLSLNVLLKGQLEFLNQYYQITAVSGKNDDLFIVKEREKVQIKSVKIKRQISPVNDIKSLIKLYFLFKKEKPDIVHSITPKAGLLSMIAAKMAKIPVRMHTFTGLIFPDRTGLLQQILIKMDKLLCACATHIYPEGKGVQSDLLQYKITNKPLNVIANGNINGIDTQYFNPDLFTPEVGLALKQELKIKKDDFVFIFVGRLVGDKGINELVAAFRRLNKENQNVKLLLVGPLETELDPLKAETLQEINTNLKIISVGFRQDVRPYFALSDALAFPSYREGFPNVVMQAGAMGLPSVVTDINGCNEIIIEEENGIIIPAKNEDALFKAMERLVVDKELRVKLSGNARRLIVARYEQKMVWEAILAEYRRIEKENA